MTALAVVSLIEDGALELGTTARSLLGEDLPLIADDVTVEHLLAHRSGIGDYLDEDGGRGITDYVMPVPVHLLATAEEYVPILLATDEVRGRQIFVLQRRFRGARRLAEQRAAFRITSS